MNGFLSIQFAVVPILVGPLQVLLAILPAILVGLGSALLALFKPATFKLALKLLWKMKISIVVVLILATGGFAAVRAALRKPAGTIAKTEAVLDQWPMFRGNAARTGAVSGSPSPIDGAINWVFYNEAKTFYSSPAIVGNRLYITSAEVGVFSNRGAVYCLDADSGAVVWKSVPDGFRATFSSPAISGKYLVTGEGLHQTRDARISCLDVTRQGALLWSYRTKSHVESSPVIYQDRVYIGAGDDGYYCFQLQPDPRGEPVLVWHLPREKYADAESSPVAHDGRVYFGLGLEGQAIVCVNAETGAEIWRLPTPFPVFSPPTIVRDKLFVGMGHGNFVESAEQIRQKAVDNQPLASGSEWPLEGEVWCVDLATAKIEWRFKTDRTVLGAVVGGEDGVVFGSRGGTVYRVDFDGRTRATWNAHAPIVASLALTPTHVYIASEKGRLSALEASSLQPVFDTTVSSTENFLSSPTIARGHLYVGSPEDGLFCLGQPAGQSSPIWQGPFGGSGAGGNIDRIPLANEGRFAWNWSGIGEGEAATKITAPAAAIKNRLFIPVAGPARNGLVCLPTQPDSAASRAEEWFSAAINPVTLSPAASDKFVAFVDGTTGSTKRRLHFVETKTGTKLWTSEVNPEASGITVLLDDAVLVEDQAGKLSSFDFSGQKRWQRSLETPSASSNLPRLAGAPAISESLVILTTTMTNALSALDKVGGAILWQVALSEAPLSGPVVHRKTILLGTATGISAHRIIDGTRLWQAAVGEVNSGLVLGRSFVAAVNSAGELIVVDPESGAIQARQAGVLPGLPPLLAAPEALLYATSEALVLYDVPKQTSSTWMKTAAFGAITSPLIMASSSVYFATDRLGLICAGKVSE